MYDEIRDAKSAPKGKQQAMFHYQVLIHAAELKDANAEEFCLAVGKSKGDIADFNKMRALHKLMQELRLP